MVGKQVLATIVIVRHTGDLVVRIHVRDEVLLELRLPAHEDTVAPSGNPILVGGVIQATAVIILVRRVKVKIALLKHAENLVFLAGL